jgi:hypothetical protein
MPLFWVLSGGETCGETCGEIESQMSRQKKEQKQPSVAPQMRSLPILDPEKQLHPFAASPPPPVHPRRRTDTLPNSDWHVFLRANPVAAQPWFVGSTERGGFPTPNICYSAWSGTICSSPQARTPFSQFPPSPCCINLPFRGRMARSFAGTRDPVRELSAVLYISSAQQWALFCFVSSRRGLGWRQRNVPSLLPEAQPGAPCA